jgi:hypothetical protein
MNQEPASIRQRIRTPRAAAVTGIVFSLLFITSLLLIWVSIPANPLGPATAVINHLKTISFSLDLLPFAGIAFLWFIAVVRDRLGDARTFSLPRYSSAAAYCSLRWSLAQQRLLEELFQS